MNLLDELRGSGSTICMVTHELRYADFADSKIFMCDGRVVDEETMHRLHHEEDERLMRAARVAESGAPEMTAMTTGIQGDIHGSACVMPGAIARSLSGIGASCPAVPKP